MAESYFGVAAGAPGVRKILEKALIEPVTIRCSLGGLHFVMAVHFIFFVFFVKGGGGGGGPFCLSDQIYCVKSISVATGCLFE